jgi:signal transduction histidine kinase
LSSLTEQAFQLLGDCVLFHNLSIKERELLFARVRIRNFASGDTIFRIGSVGNSMMILLHGRIQISADLPGGRSLLIAVVSPGEMFGEIAVLDGGRRSANATAETACSVAILDRDDILEFLEKIPGLCRNIVSLLCSHLRSADHRLVEITLLHDEIREKNRLLVEASEDKSRFLAAASHDLRQPLYALGLFTAQLHDRMKSPEDALLTSRINTAVATMNDLFDALLDISKLDAGALTPAIADFPIVALLTRIDSTFATLADQKGLSFRLHTGSDIWVRSDPILLERIVLNLVSNAVRYTTTGGIVVGYRRRDHSLRIEVWDTGPGIPEEQRRKIFSEFYRIGGNDEAGLGLGLAIVERLSRLLEHPLDLSSTPGKGSRFSVTVPISWATEI